MQPVKQPLGGWPKNRDMKRAGFIAALAASTGFESYAIAPMTRYLGMSAAEVTTLCQRAQLEVESRKVHAYGIV